MKQTLEFLGRIHDSAEIIMERYGLDPMKLYRWTKKGLLPKPVKLGRNRFYPREEVDSRLSRGE